jgi:hypothetical protein
MAEKWGENERLHFTRGIYFIFSFFPSGPNFGIKQLLGGWGGVWKYVPTALFRHHLLQRHDEHYEPAMALCCRQVAVRCMRRIFFTGSISKYILDCRY